MKLLKKATMLFLALGMTAGFAACGDKGGDNSSVDTGAAKGEQVTLEQWTTAVTNTFAADNVTITGGNRYQFHEEWDGVTCVGSGEMNATIKLANGMVYGDLSGVDTYDGETEEWTQEYYIIQEQGTYYKYLRRDGETEWSCDEHDDAKYNPNFSVTLEWSVFVDFGDADYFIALYDSLVYDETNGEYSFFMEDGSDQFEISVKIRNGKFYTMTIFSTDAAAIEGDYDETKFVFTNYGTTTIGSLPNEEDGEEDGVESDSVKTSGAILIEGSTQESWQKAIEATLAQTNFTVSGNVAMEAMGVSDTGTETLVFEGEKLYHEENTSTGVYRTYVGMVESDGLLAPYVWEWNKDTSSWDCEFGNLISTAEEAFGCLTFDTYIDRLFSAYALVTFNASGVGSVDLAELLPDSTVTGTLEITFSNGLVSKIKVEAEDEPIQGLELISEYEYVITYGNATVGNLPAVTI